MKLAKQHLDVGLFTAARDTMLAFCGDTLGLPYEELLKVGGGQHQHRFGLNGSVLKVNHVRDALADAEAGPIARLRIARAGLVAARALRDADGNAFLLVPPGDDAVTNIGIDLDCADAERTRRFYIDALGGAAVDAQRVRVGTTLLRFRGPDEWLLPARSAPTAAAMRARGFRYLTAQVYDVVAEHAAILEAGGQEGRAPVRRGDVAYISFIRDPAGTWIEISQRRSLTGSLD